MTINPQILLVTGGCGFIGSHFVLRQISAGKVVINLDKLTYAANLANVASVANHPNYHFVQGDINDCELAQQILNQYRVEAVVNFAAESHVDNSIARPEEFIITNINGTYQMLMASLKYYQHLDLAMKENFRFLHISTDEVFGSLQPNEPAFTANNRYQPNSPYSASKASSDHLVRAWHETFKLPTIITNCSNNYGANQHKEKLIPKIIEACQHNLPIPIYGKGDNIRDWIFVEDHCHGIELALAKGKIGGTYLFGGENELTNLAVATTICDIFNQLAPKASNYREQINFVADRLGHDFRYAIDNSQSQQELGFRPSNSFATNIKAMIKAILG